MKLSTKGRYAARAMLDLALNFNKKPIQLKEIAKRQDISLRYLEHIMSALVSGKLVHGVRGKLGGFTLSKAPEMIKLSDIIYIVEGSLAPVHCVEHPESCKKVQDCIAHDIWQEMHEAVKGVLDSYTLADMVVLHKKKTDNKDLPMYHI